MRFRIEFYWCNMKIKTSELTGRALDWSVAMAIIMFPIEDYIISNHQIIGYSVGN
ncbi:conserved hypothetical protein [Xenorhabdus nematophila F1]|uniref:Uncharacterized protein n=1 Tax=Xenorhabdus nematophila (strain ATCC 19061 / DSM 3370 / CCUG 14189 / LMG 1036 / NCIMB 9965 / AN6) TaxID=406817 RepID=D3VIG0_XENNA|nr:hypothetical protein XNC1_2746 [Xenorhabdus nematophila ATCC 19061]CCW29298.1 conserved hypothetical protein [Xenorhabdus nematophila F1]CEK23638.1 hypothetical protein XNC2_2644 [Xenorhabdus nematophila AN6/1]